MGKFIVKINEDKYLYSFIPGAGEKNYTDQMEKAHQFPTSKEAFKCATANHHVVIDLGEIEATKKEKEYRKVLKGFLSCYPAEISITAEMGSHLRMPNITTEAILYAVEQYLKK